MTVTLATHHKRTAACPARGTRPAPATLPSGAFLREFCRLLAGLAMR